MRNARKDNRIFRLVSADFQPLSPPPNGGFFVDFATNEIYFMAVKDAAGNPRNIVK